jgi:hypothetical protein
MEGATQLWHVFIPVSDQAPANPLIGLADAPTTKLAGEIEMAANDEKVAPRVREIITSGAMDDLDGVTLSSLWSRLSSSPNSTTRLVALGSLIRKGQAGALQTVAGLQPATINAQDQAILGAALLAYRNMDPVGIRALGQMVTKRYSEPVRSGAAEALKAIHTQDTLPYLTALLDSESRDLRYQAVSGIASFANGLPVQTKENYATMAFLVPNSNADFKSTDETRANFPMIDTFFENEQKYILFWKKWLADNGLVKP